MNNDNGDNGENENENDATLWVRMRMQPCGRECAMSDPVGEAVG